MPRRGEARLPQSFLIATRDRQFDAAGGAVNEEARPVRELYHDLRLPMTYDSGHDLAFEQLGGTLGLGVHVHRLIHLHT